MTRNDCRQNIIIRQSIFGRRAARDGNPFSRGATIAFPTIPGHWFLYTLSTPVARCNLHDGERDLRSAVNSKLIDKYTVVGRSACRGCPSRTFPQESRTHVLFGAEHTRLERSSKMSQSEVQFHYSRFTPALGSAIAFPVPRVVFLGIVFFPSPRTGRRQELPSGFRWLALIVGAGEFVVMFVVEATRVWFSAGKW